MPPQTATLPQFCFFHLILFYGTVAGYGCTYILVMTVYDIQIEMGHKVLQALSKNNKAVCYERIGTLEILCLKVGHIMREGISGIQMSRQVLRLFECGSHLPGTSGSRVSSLISYPNFLKFE